VGGVGGGKSKSQRLLTGGESAPKEKPRGRLKGGKGRSSSSGGRLPAAGGKRKHHTVGTQHPMRVGREGHGTGALDYLKESGVSGQQPRGGVKGFMMVKIRTQENRLDYGGVLGVSLLFELWKRVSP